MYMAFLILCQVRRYMPAFTAIYGILRCCKARQCVGWK
jgi:hypothetical protein